MEYGWPGSDEALCRTVKFSSVFGDPQHYLCMAQNGHPFQVTLRGYWTAAPEQSQEGGVEAAVGRLLTKFAFYQGRGGFLFLPDTLIHELTESWTLSELLDYEEVYLDVVEELYGGLVGQAKRSSATDPGSEDRDTQS